MSVYGYCRISTAKQNIERQIRNILAYNNHSIIVQEVFTGTKFQDRKEFEKLMKKVHSGDTIIFDSVSRMSRNSEEGFLAYEELYNRGVSLVFLKEPHINTDTYKNTLDSKLKIHFQSGDNATDKLMDTIITALNDYTLELAKKQIQLSFVQSEKEVADLHQRTKEGIETARMAGKQIGRKEGASITTKKSITAKVIIKQHSKTFGGTLNDEETMKLAGVSRVTYYKYKSELKDEINSMLTPIIV